MSESFNDGGMSSLIMQAAQSAAQADGLIAANNDRAQQQQQHAMARALQMQQQQQQQIQQIQQNNNSGGGKKKGPPLRRGKWTPEEEAYANRLIQEFKAGLLPLTDGTTLRTFLSKLLNCDPMRISKKFVGGNCIGKQVFRRRTADLNRLTPEQIQKSRAELSELERRFLERVAQTNRVKSSGVGATAAPGGPNNQNVPTTVGGAASSMGGSHDFQRTNQNNLGGASRQGHHEPPSPPWLQPPLGFKHGNGAVLASSNLSGSSSRAAAAGRALLGGSLFQRNNNDKQQQSNNDSRDFLAELQRRASQQSMLQSLQQQNQSSASNFLAAAVRSGNNGGLSGGGGSGLSMAQLAQSASAARLASNPSVSDLMLKTGLSRDQLSQLARDRGGLSSGSLSSMLQGQRQNSFDALMSLDFQSLQSIDNLANLIQSGGMNHVPESGLRNAEFVASRTMGSSGDFASDMHLGSAGRMESFLRNFSNSNMGQNNTSGSSNANLSSLLQSMGNLNQFGAGISNNGGNNSSGNLWANNAQSAASLANLLRQDSSTGLTALRVQDGLNSQRNSSVDDFLSLMAAGDIPHQDPSMLDIPLMQQQHGQDSAARLLAHQQLMQSNPALANALASHSLGNLSAGGLSSSALAAAGNKRKLTDVAGLLQSQEGNKH